MNTIFKAVFFAAMLLFAYHESKIMDTYEALFWILLCFVGVVGFAGLLAAIILWFEEHFF